MTDDVEKVTLMCWKISKFIGTRSQDDEFGIFSRGYQKKEDVYRVMDEYPANFIAPPENAYDDLFEKEFLWKFDDENVWDALIPLWSEEEGSSDLCLQVTIDLESCPPQVELRDCLVA